MGSAVRFVPISVLMVLVFLSFAENVSAGMSCQLAFGMGFTCPVPFQDESKMYCCHNKDRVPYCCDLPDYIFNSTAIIAGVVSGSVVLLLLVILCCCCCCSCCLLAKRRQSRGVVLYDPVANAPPAPYPTAQPGNYVVQPIVYPSAYPMQPTVHNPPPPCYNDIPQQPPFNPTYPQQGS